MDISHWRHRWVTNLWDLRLSRGFSQRPPASVLPAELVAVSGTRNGDLYIPTDSVQELAHWFLLEGSDLQPVGVVPHVYLRGDVLLSCQLTLSVTAQARPFVGDGLCFNWTDGLVSLPWSGSIFASGSNSRARSSGLLANVVVAVEEGVVERSRLGSLVAKSVAKTAISASAKPSRSSAENSNDYSKTSHTGFWEDARSQTARRRVGFRFGPGSVVHPNNPWVFLYSINIFAVSDAMKN